MANQLIKDIKEIHEYLGDTYTVIVSSIKIRLLIFMSNMLQKVHNRRFFVSVIEKPGGERLKIFDKYMFDSYKRRGWMPKRMTTLELEQKCFYATPLSKNNKVTKDEKKKAIRQYANYSKMMRKVQLAKRPFAKINK
jgi:hypothetical protein